MTNRAVLVGRLTKDPELRFTPNGIAVTTFTLAVNRPFKNANGEQEADFINIVVWKKAAENVANYTSKGSLVAIDGRIQTRSYENKDGQRVYVTEVVADSVQFLETKKREAQQQNSQQRYTSDPGTPFQGGQPVDISDDDLPF
jgi:single-strand DNA-binding protein